MTVTLTWTDATGAVTPLTEANGYRVLRDVQGLDAPPVMNTIEDQIVFDGGLLADRRRAVRPVVLPLWVKHTSRVQTRIAELTRMLRGPGRLEFADGTNTRYLQQVIYEAGLGGDLGRDVAMPDWRKVAVSLLALDPWWYGAAQGVALPVAVATVFDAAIPFDDNVPFDGGSAVSINVAGDGDASPVVTVYGPATNVVVGAGGQEWQTVTALSADDVLVVDSRPGSRGPRLNGGVVDWSLLTAASRLWMLAPGLQSVVVGTTGSSGATVIGLEYSPRWLTP